MFLTNLKKIRKKFICFSNILSINALKKLPSKVELTLVDIGAAGEIEPRWKPFVNYINYIGFEPDKRSRDIISNAKENFKKYKIYPFALSKSEKDIFLNLCRKPQVSSIYKPNNKFLNRFPDSERFNVLGKITLKCKTLDSLNLSKIDFIKIDVQGAEYNVIKGASSTLNSVLGLELEVEFLELYKGQPLFGDIADILTDRGFEFIDFVNLCRWERKNHNGHGQCIFGDALFLRTPEFLLNKNITIKDWSVYISILIIYRRFDLVDITLDLLPKDTREIFNDFELTFKKMKRLDSVVKFIFTFFNRCISIFGHSYRLHLFR